MKSEDIEQIKEPFRLSLFLTVIVLVGCVAGLWLASLILQFPAATLSYMKIGGAIILPIAALAFSFRRKK